MFTFCTIACSLIATYFLPPMFVTVYLNGQTSTRAVLSVTFGRPERSEALIVAEEALPANAFSTLTLPAATSTYIESGLPLTLPERLIDKPLDLVTLVGMVPENLGKAAPWL